MGLETRSRGDELERALGGGWSVAAAAAVEEWHFRFAARTFATEVTRDGRGRLALTPGIDDPEWNHLSDVRWREVDFAANLRQAALLFAARALRPVIVVTPWSEPADLFVRLRARGWTVVFRHLWSFFDLAAPEVEVSPVAPYVHSRVESPRDMEDFLRLFVAVYDADGALGEGYAPALRRSLTQPGVRHHLIRHAGEPVGIGTLLVDGERSQIFNMVVHAAHRRHGLAEWLLNARLREAQRAGARRLTALSDNGRIDRWLEARGFAPGWFSVGYAPAGTNGGEHSE